MLTRTYFAPAMGLLIALLVGLAGEQGFSLERMRIQQDQRNTVISMVGQYRAALEGELNGSLYLADGLVAYIEAHTVLERDLMQMMLKSLYEQGQHIRNIGLAPDNRLTYIYPIAGNVQAIGLYYPDLPDQWPAVQQAISERKPRLAGPISLIQGGTGFVYRVPVFVGSKRRYWGLLSMVIDQDALFKSLNLAPRVNGLNLALRGKDGVGAAGAVFMGDPDLFTSDSIKATIRTPGGEWQLAARPVSGWSVGRHIHWIRWGGWSIGAMLGVAIYLALVSIARRLHAEQAVRNTMEELGEAQRVAMIGSWKLDMRSNQLTWSDEIFHIFEIDPTRFGASYDAFLNAIHPEDRERVDRAYNESVARHQPYEIVHRLLFADGRIKYVHERGETRYDRAGKPVFSRGTVQDVTDFEQAREALRESEARWKFALEGSGDGLWDWNITTGELYLSRQGMEVLCLDGGHDAHIRMEDFTAHLHPDDRQIREQALARYFSGDTALYTCEFRIRCPDGTLKWILARGMLVSHTAEGKPLRMIGTHSDISARKQVEAELVHLATTDPLTGVANRRHFLEAMETELARTRRSGRPVAMLMVDIDHFKNINDSHGHVVGDAVLKHFAQLSVMQLRRADRFGRLGGEEFGFLLPETDSDGAWQFAERFRRVVADTPAQSTKGDIRFTISIGIAMLERQDTSIDDILARADAALYRAKEGGRNRVEQDTGQAG